MTDEFDDDDSLPLRELHRLLDGACAGCGIKYTAHEAVGSIALGFKNAPRCHACLSAGLGRDPVELRQQIIDYVHRRECFLKAWREADRLEGESAPSPPASGGEGWGEGGEGPRLQPPSPLTPPPLPPQSRGERETSWDAGDLACGELVLQLRIRLNNLPPGSVLHVVARDPAAPEDLPAWCRLGGHVLLSAEHPEYRIRRKEP